MSVSACRLQRILIADDDEDDCILFQDALDELSIDSNLTFARNGNELLTILKNEVLPLPDIIFLDLNMPMKNGIECLIEIRADQRLKNITIVICSTSAQQAAVDRSYELKADLYIRKPDTFLKFKHALAQALSINWKELPRFTKDRFLINL